MYIHIMASTRCGGREGHGNPQWHYTLGAAVENIYKVASYHS